MESNDLNLEETNDIHKGKGSDSASKLDLNLSVSKEEKGSDGCAHANTASDDGKEMDLNQEVQASSLLLVDGSVCESESTCTRLSSMAPSVSLVPDCPVNKTGRTGELCTVLTGDLVARNLEDGQETTNSPICSGKPKLADHDGYAANSSSPLKTDAENVGSDNYAVKLNSQLENDAEMEGCEDKETGDSARHVSSLPSTVDPYDHSEEMARENCGPCLSKSHPCDGEKKEKADKFSKSLSDINEEVEGQNPVQYVELPSSRAKISSDNGEVEQENSDLHSPDIFSKRSASPFNQMPMSSESSPSRLASAGQTKCSPAEVVVELCHSSTTQKRSLASPERIISDGKGLSYNHSSPSKLKSSSPLGMPRQDSQRQVGSPQKRLSTSPKRRYSPPVPQRRERSSRSPMKRNDSSSRNRREGRKRSRSRSPYATDRRRRSPRRYSPRRRSPLGCHPRNRFPRRPWSPPPNRSTGAGRPGKNLFVAGFSFVTTERDLERKFSRFGPVRNVRIVRDKRTGDSRGFGFLSFEKDEDADAAIRALDQMEWNGRIVLVEKSKTYAP
ncbi:hypothetical protein ACLOJK_029723 [Asimina triloba]